jgi:hypothetical protein
MRAVVMANVIRTMVVRMQVAILMQILTPFVL